MQRKPIQQKANLTHSQRGGVTLEYILICVFSVVSGMAALGYVHKIVKSKIAQMETQLEQGASSWGDGSLPQ